MVPGCYYVCYNRFMMQKQSESQKEKQSRIKWYRKRIYKEKLYKAGILLILPAGLVTFLFLHQFGGRMAELFPACLFRRMTGFYCPGCGNTRSVLALLHGDIFTSLRYNITPVVLGIVLSLLYVEGLTYVFGCHRKILPRDSRFWWVVLSLMFLYFIARNFFPYLIP